MSNRHKLEQLPRKFAGVAGKVIRSIESSMGEEYEPHVCIQFDDGTEIDIAMESKVDVAVQWYEEKDGDTSQVRRKAFL